MEVREARARDQLGALGWFGVVLAFMGLGAFLNWWFHVGAVSALLIVPGVWLLLRWLSRTWAYRCPNCGVLFQLGMLSQFTAINMGDERNVKCPRCRKRSWVKILRRLR